MLIPFPTQYWLSQADKVEEQIWDLEQELMLREDMSPYTAEAKLELLDIRKKHLTVLLTNAVRAAEMSGN